MYFILNEAILKSDHACLSPLGKGLQYGFGLFETIHVTGGKIHFLKEHLARMSAGCTALGMDWTVHADLLSERCQELIKANKIHDGSLKILYAKGTDANDLLISTQNRRYEKEQYIRGFKLSLAEARRDPQNTLTYLKSLNYLENLLAKELAASGGYDEAIFLNPAGKVCEGTCSNIFMVKDKILHTPAKECGLLPGILRKKVLDLADKEDLMIRTASYGIDFLLEADEVFLTNSLMQIMPVSGFRETRYDLKTNEITRYLQQKFQEVYYSQAE